MDHRISKDMISNGMTPSGQKSQQDLSRSQYGSAATPSSLAEAYRKIHEMDERSAEYNRKKQEDAKAAAHKKRQEQNAAQAPTRVSDGGASTGNAPTGGKGGQTGRTKPRHPGTSMPGSPGGRVDSNTAGSNTYQLPKRTPQNAANVEYYKDDVDLFDIIKGHLMGEGLSEEDALNQMLDMTEEEKAEIVEGAPYVVTNADKRGNTPAYQGLMKGAKNKLTGKPLYVAAPHLKGV